ncbi:hypothetical protein JNN96_36115 [Mycobacterium sp. DSM 3803]|nr:hypothetical protein [Mycobacterium sp. DSM 3803]
MDNQDFKAQYLNDDPSEQPGSDEGAGIVDAGQEEAVIDEPVLPPEPVVSDPAPVVEEPTIVRPFSAAEAAVIERHRSSWPDAPVADRRDIPPPAYTPPPPPESARTPNGTAPQGYSNGRERPEYQAPQHQQAHTNGRGNHHATNTGQWQARQPFENPQTSRGVAVTRPGTDQESAAPLRVSNWAYGNGKALDPTWAGESTKHLRHDELAAKRRVPAESGWRKAVYTASGHLINLGAGPAERKLREQIAQIGNNIPGNYQVAVVSVGGGVGKTRMTAALGTVFRMHRNEPVVAVDVDPTYGTLGRVVDPRTTSAIREYVADSLVTTYPQSRKHTGQNEQGLEVLGGNQNVGDPVDLSEKLFTDTLHRTQRFYPLALMDCGKGIEHPVMTAVLRNANALVIVGGANWEGAAAAEKTIDWLAARRAHDLLRRSVVVLNDRDNCANPKFLATVKQSFEPRVGAVKTVPFDKHLRDAAVLDFEALQRPTQLALIEIAAWLAEGFPTPGGVSPR